MRTPGNSRRRLFPGDSALVDLSPMIDLVFLLLIFFMVSSTLITYRQDPTVKIPVASAAKVPKLVQGRVVLNVYEDGSVVRENGERLDAEGIERAMRAARQSDPGVRLHLRADREAAHRHVKEVVAAAARGGVTTVLFSTHVSGN